MPSNEGGACDDAQFCTVTDSCAAGICGGGPRDCSAAGDQCNDGVCNETGDVCEPQPANEGLACDDGNACNNNDICTTGVCAGSGGPDCDDGNPCTADTCDVVLGCINTAVADGTACDDSTVCNGAETCAAGICNAGTPLDCNDGLQCTIDTCDAVLGCLNTNVPDGTSCNDADACTTGDACVTGLCVGGAPPDCNDGNQCTTDTCDVALGCQNTNVSNGTPCTDGSLCTVGDTCQTGSCTPGPAADCDDGELCTIDSCVPATGCQNSPLPDGTPCDDSDTCTTVDLCSVGVCVGGGSPFDCDDSNPCTTDACDPIGGCSNIALPDGTGCSDDQFCTVGDTCTTGFCGGGPRDCSAAGDQCNLGVCNETADLCEPMPSNEGGACDDALFCTTGEICIVGVCAGGGPTDCTGLDNQCETGVCNETTNACEPQPANEGFPCDDGNACTSNDTCSTGICAGGIPPNCDDGNVCTADSCDDLLGCQNIPVADGSACGDGSVCNGAELCQAGICTAGTPIDCNDGNACNVDTCDPISGCVHTPVPNGAGCDDGFFCTVGETCTSGTCGGGAARDCSPLDDQCNDGVCDDAVDSCVQQPTNEGIACDDSVFCTTGETCVSGVCGAGSLTDCSVLDDQCNLGVCDAISDSCIIQPANEGLACTDGDACTAGDACQTGTCVPAGPQNCDDGNQCTVDTCESAGGCINTPVPDGFACEDGSACTTGDACVSGVCLGGAPPDCDDGNACTNDTCNPALGCLTSAAADGTACDDGDECSTGDACQAGVCVGGSAPDCDDGNTCTTDVCSATLGCQHAVRPNGTPCDDSNVCTTVDECSLGVCVSGGAPLDCSDGNPCTDDTCIDFAGCSHTPNTDPCDDGQFCTNGEVCAAGVCGGGLPIDCSASGDQCNVGACDDNIDACVPAPANEGTACDDALFCTTAEVCLSGTCGGGAPTDCTAFDDQCNQGVCDETADTCMAQAISEGFACDDGQFCTTAEKCVSGVCGAGSPTDCSAQDDQCNVGVCDETGDTCLPQPANEGLGCDDALFCTAGEICSAGICGGGGATDCTALDDQCNQGTCDEVSDLCFPLHINEGIACDDANSCTLSDACQSGICVGGAPPDCDDSNECTVDTCSVASGCVNAPVPDGNACDDANACTTPDKCVSGLCISGPPPDCDDDNTCTADSCDALAGCTSVAVIDGTPCVDDDLCTASDACLAGICTGGPPPDCDDGNTCTADACVTGLGCRNAPIPDTTACDDLNACTTVDFCSLGVCVGGGAPLACDDLEVCTDDSCEPLIGCVFTPNVAPCEEGDLCTVNDICAGGVCTPGTPAVCDDLDVCTDDSCDSALGCVTTPNSLACDDLNACTANDVCADSTCNPGTPVICDDTNTCTDDSCDPAIGCIFAVKSDGTFCSDGNACTRFESCQSGTCAGGQPLTCDDNNVCTNDSCDSLIGCRFDQVSCDDGNPCTLDTCHPLQGCQSQLDGDTDGDGQPNICDPCPNDADNDADTDGICGDKDNCPGLSNPDQLDADKDEVGNLCDPDSAFVDLAASCAPGDCSCGTVARPFATIGAAINCAPPPGAQGRTTRAILLRPGVHNAFNLQKSVHVQAEDPETLTVIQGTAFGPAIEVTSSGTLYGVTVQGGNPGILVRNGSPRILDNHITFNFANLTDPNDPASSSGGGLRILQGAPLVDGNLFTLNFASDCGGAIYAGRSAPTIRGNELRQNTASTGGAICLFNSASKIEANRIEDNTASADGGGIYMDQSASIIEGGLIARNRAGAVTGRGGGLYLFISAPVIKDTEISQNDASEGGGIFVLSSDPTLTRTRILDNSAAANGGAISVRGPNAAGRLSSSIFVGNGALNGGAIHCDAGTSVLNVINNTFFGNLAGTSGAALSASSCTFTFQNNIVMDQLSAMAVACDATTTSDVGYNDFFANGAGDLDIGCTSSGPAFSFDPGLVGCGYHLSLGSPAIDRGFNTASGIPSLDLDGDARIMDGNGDLTAVADLGADELSCSDTDRDGVNQCAGDCDDRDATVFPGAPELCDGKDNDCNCVVDDSSDADGDLFSVCAGDCNDGDPNIFPGAAEACDFIDNNCNNIVDEGFDLDGDGVTTCAGDCDDSEPTVFPGGTEVCDLLDNDCNGLTDDDQDGDGFTPCGGDCDEGNLGVNPLALEICDGIDNNCNLVIDEGCP
jgi:hypothetical protein